MTAQSKQEILLESGTNEMELLEFYLNDQPFAINVLKMREIITYNPDSVTVLPDSPPSLLGQLLLRGFTLPLIDLKKHLKQPEAENSGGKQPRQVVLITRFDNNFYGFLVDGANKIHRAFWHDIQPMPSTFEQYRPRFTGSICIEKRDILIVDFEQIIAELFPEAALDYDTGAHKSLSLVERRQQMKLMLAEDSALIRKGIEKVLKNAGYNQLEIFINGEGCYRRIIELKTQADSNGTAITDSLNLVITDIEMPQLDGLTLCRRIKKEMLLKEVKVVMFSSLINEEMALKCDQVGADGYASKPQIPELVSMLDALLFDAGDKA